MNNFPTKYQIEEFFLCSSRIVHLLTVVNITRNYLVDNINELHLR